MSARNRALVWRGVTWPRPFEPDVALELLSRLSADRSLGTIVWEARGDAKKIHYLIGCSPERIHTVSQVLTSQVDGARFCPDIARKTPNLTARVRVGHPSLALSTDRVLATVRSVLAGLTAARPGRE